MSSHSRARAKVSVWSSDTGSPAWRSMRGKSRRFSSRTAPVSPAGLVGASPASPGVREAVMVTRVAACQVATRFSVLVRQRALRRRQSRNRHPEGAARDVVEPDGVKEGDRRRVAAVLAADADLEVGPCGAAALDGDLDQLADAALVEAGKGPRRGCLLARYSGRKVPTSSRLKPKVIWVRSLVPKEKNSASRRPRRRSGGARHSRSSCRPGSRPVMPARLHLLGDPPDDSLLVGRTPPTCPISGIMISGNDGILPAAHVGGGLEDRPDLHLG